MTKFYDDGGAIDTSDQDNSGAPPVMGTPSVPAEDDSSGVDQAQQQQPQQQGSPDVGLGQPQGPLGGVAKRIIAYLQGADASHPDSIDAVGRMVDPEGKMPPADRNVVALDRVRNQYGDNAAWQLMQANRVAYNAQTAFGKVALQGTPQKPADINAAIDAANKAQANVLDGSNIQFARAGGGDSVTAMVTMPGTRTPQQIQLSPQAFAAFLDIGGDGQWDKLMENSAPVTLQRLAKQYPPQGISKLSQMKPLAAQSPAASPASADEEEGGDEPKPKTNFGKTPSTLNLTGSDEQQPPGNEPDTGIDPDVEARANRLFPNASQAAQRNQYISSELSRSESLENQVEVAKEKGKLANERARIMGGARVQGAEAIAGGRVKASENYGNARTQLALAKLQAAAQHEEAVNGRTAQSMAMHGLVSKVSTGQALTPQEQTVWDRLTQGAQPQQQAAPQVSAAPPPPAQRVAGQTKVTTAKGSFVWGNDGKWHSAGQ